MPACMPGPLCLLRPASVRFSFISGNSFGSWVVVFFCRSGPQRTARRAAVRRRPTTPAVSAPAPSRHASRRPGGSSRAPAPRPRRTRARVTRATATRAPAHPLHTTAVRQIATRQWRADACCAFSFLLALAHRCAALVVFSSSPLLCCTRVRRVLLDGRQLVHLLLRVPKGRLGRELLLVQLGGALHGNVRRAHAHRRPVQGVFGKLLAVCSGVKLTQLQSVT